MKIKETIFSPCRKYRYTLWREWDEVPLWSAANGRANHYVQFIGLNPSTADETQDDPTIRRCIGFAKAWGYGALCMTNLFAWRDTDPKAMKKAGDSVAGIDNQHHLLQCASNAGIVIAAWGRDGAHLNQDLNVRQYMDSINIPLHHPGLNSDGTPKHPLYLKKTTKPEPWMLNGARLLAGGKKF